MQDTVKATGAKVLAVEQDHKKQRAQGRNSRRDDDNLVQSP
jgi:hypothetical protein